MTEDCLTETDRLILRLVKETDLEDLLLLFQDPVATRYFPSTRDRDGTKQWIDRTWSDTREMVSDSTQLCERRP